MDTCAFLWLAVDDSMLTDTAADSCRDRDNEVFQSESSVRYPAAVLW